MLAGAGLSLPELSPALQQASGAFIPAYGSALNPVDITAQAVLTGGLVRATELLCEFAEGDAVLAVVALGSETRMALDVAAPRAIVARPAEPVLFYSYTRPSGLSPQALATAGRPPPPA